MPPLDGAESDSPPSGVSRTHADITGECDPPGIELVENLHALAPLLETLDERERAIVQMRFGGEEMTQSQIGERLGLSQMHVSRLIARILGKLREGILTEE